MGLPNDCYRDFNKPQSHKGKISKGPEADRKNKKDFGAIPEILVCYGDPTGNRTRVSGVRGRLVCFTLFFMHLPKPLI